jgi:hypothetical protein
MILVSYLSGKNLQISDELLGLFLAGMVEWNGVRSSENQSLISSGWKTVNLLALTGGEEGGPVQGVQDQVHPEEFAKYSPCTDQHLK